MKNTFCKAFMQKSMNSWKIHSFIFILVKQFGQHLKKKIKHVVLFYDHNLGI